MGKRESYQLTNVEPYKTFNLNFVPASLAIQNTSPFACYVRIGGVDKPGTKSFTDIIPPYTSYVADPAGAVSFAVFVDNSSAPSLAFTFPVVVTFSTGAASVQSPMSTAIQQIAATGYDAKIQSVVGSALVVFLPLEDLTGLSAVDLVAAQNWSYASSGVTLNQAGIGDSKPSVIFDGAAGQVSPGAPALAFINSHWSPDFGTMGLWLFVTSANMAAAGQPAFVSLAADGNNQYLLYKNTVNVVSISIRRSGISQYAQNQPYTGNAWIFLAVTWNASTNKSKFYVNGIEPGIDGNCANTFVGSLTGGGFTALANYAGNFLPGNLAKFFLANRELSAAEILQLAAIA